MRAAIARFQTAKVRCLRESVKKRSDDPALLERDLHDASTISNRLTSVECLLEEAIADPTEQALRRLFYLTFYAGTEFARVFESNPPGRKATNTLTPIIDAALARHGDLSATELLTRMGGKKEWAKGRQLPLFKTLVVNWEDFEKKVTQQKDSSGRVPGRWHRLFTYSQLPVQK
jgi:hypothetical protein